MQEELKSRNEFDYTMMSTFLRCRRKYDYRINQGYIPKRTPSAPGFGKSIHLALDSWFTDLDVTKAIRIFKEDYQEDLERDDKRTHRLGEWILKNYHEKYQDQPYKLLATEMEFKVDLPNGNKLIGRIDKIVDWDGTIWVLDHKTTSSLGASYTKMAEPNLQFDGYVYAARKLGFKAVGVILDAILVAKGLLDDTSRARLTPLIRWDSYRSDEQLEEYEKIVSSLQHQILGCEVSGSWLPNYDSCVYYGECPYRMVCMEGHDVRQRMLDSEYKIEHWSPIREEKVE